MTFNTSTLTTLLKTMRPSFLVLTLACVFLGFAISQVTLLNRNQSIDSIMLLLVCIGAIAAHISVNMLNEYHDFYSGLDLKTKRTAFSGGSGALPENPKIANLALVFGLLALLVTVVIGLYFMITLGNSILPIGLVGLLIIVTYTKWLNRMPVLCLISPGLGFGLLMVVGTHLVLTSGYSTLIWPLSLVPFFLINNLLLLNQYPDMEADASVGRKTFPLAFGIKRSNQVYTLFMFAAYALILFYIFVGILPLLSAIALIPMLLSLFALLGVTKHAENIGLFSQYLAANVAAAIITPTLLGLSLL
jgi:1,4-dihydroxy-2-naphthoate octaprenyltransferase